MNESTILPVERLLGAWARQSSGTRSARRQSGGDARTLARPTLSRVAFLQHIFDLNLTLDLTTTNSRSRHDYFDSTLNEYSHIPGARSGGLYSWACVHF
jgi:hypothetical protein